MTCFSNKLRVLSRSLLLLLAVAWPAHAAPTVIKMATLAPEGSSWYKMLADMGEEWKQGTGGAVTLRLYAGGVSGDEDAMLRKMRVGQLQAAAVTGLGLGDIEKGFFGLHVPMMFQSDEEFEYVRAKIAPVLERRLEEKGFVVLNWVDGGWVHFFAKKPFSRPADVKAMKLYVGAGDSTMTQIYKELGFQPVKLTTVDILPGLQTGMINAFSTTPLAALAFQWFGLANNMSDLRWARLSGATIIDRKVWQGMSEDVRSKVLKAARASGQRIQGEVRRLNDEAIRVMAKNGLKTGHAAPDAQAEWRKMMEEAYPRIRGTVVPADIFDLVRKYRDEYRAAHPAGVAAK
jgi:TRAP-type C4-dicarboxylate transport system substrate-binding protein